MDHQTIDGQQPATLWSLTRVLPGFFYQLAMTPDGEFRYQHASPSVEQLFGVSAEAVEADAATLLDRIHPDDRDRVIAGRSAAAEALQPLHCRYRMRRPDGTSLWVEARDMPLRQPDGTIIWTGYANDVTRQVMHEGALADSEIKFRVLVESANDIIYSLSPSGTIEYVSPSWTEVLGYDVDDAIGRSFEAFIHPDDVTACNEFLRSVMQTGRKQAGVEYRVRDRSGHWRWYTANASPLHDESGALVSFMGIARDITEKKVMEEKILHLALHDALTDLPNRSYFLNLADHALALAKRRQSSIAMMFVDLDGFKPVNDRFGHAAGDRVLQEVAARIRGCLRGSDAAARLGGDEFMVLLAEVDGMDGATLVAERIRERIGAPVAVDGGEATVSCSIGVALSPGHGKDVTTLERHADVAMYAAKDAGRDCVRVYDVGLMAAAS